MRKGSGAFCQESSFLRLFSRHGIGNAGRCFCSLTLATFQHSQLLTGLRQLLGVDFDFGFLLYQAIPLDGAPLTQGCLLPLGCIHSLRDGIAQNLMLLFLTLQTEHLILCFQQLILCCIHLELHLVGSTLRFLQLEFQFVFLFQ